MILPAFQPLVVLVSDLVLVPVLTLLLVLVLHQFRYWLELFASVDININIWWGEGSLTTHRSFQPAQHDQTLGHICSKHLWCLNVCPRAKKPGYRKHRRILHQKNQKSCPQWALRAQVPEEKVKRGHGFRKDWKANKGLFSLYSSHNTGGCWRKLRQMIENRYGHENTFSFSESSLGQLK